MHLFYRLSCYLYSHKFGRLLTRHRQKDCLFLLIPLIPQVAQHLLVWAHPPKRERRSSYTSTHLAICLHLHVTHGVPLHCAKKKRFTENRTFLLNNREALWRYAGMNTTLAQISGAISIFVPSEHIKKAVLSHHSLVPLRGDREEWDGGGGGWAEEVVFRVVGGWMKRGATCRNQNGARHNSAVI